jgi:uncharacterized membrane protein
LSPIRTAYTATLAGHLGLLVLVMAWTIWLSPPALPVAPVLLLWAGPLLLPLRGLLHARRYTFQWTSFLALAYFVHGAVEAFADPAERSLALAEVALSLLLYTGTVSYARLTRGQA